MSTSSSRPLAEAIPHIVWIHDASHRVVYLNRWWTEYTGESVEEAAVAGPAQRVHPDDRELVVDLFRRSAADGEVLSAVYRLRDKTNTYRWHRARVVPFRREDGRVVEWLGSAIDVHDETELAQQRRHLLEASRVLGTSLEVERTLSDVARLLVPRIADWSAIDLLDAQGKLERFAVAHIDPEKVELGWKLWRRLSPRPDDPHGAYAVIRSREPALTREITDEMLQMAHRDPETLAMFRALGLRSSMVVPLVSRDRVIGVLSLVSAESRRLFEERDLGFALELAGRIAVAVDNARLYSEATEARQAAEAMALEVLEQCRAAEAAVLELRRERDEARDSSATTKA